MQKRSKIELERVSETFSYADTRNLRESIVYSARFITELRHFLSLNYVTRQHAAVSTTLLQRTLSEIPVALRHVGQQMKRVVVRKPTFADFR
jgi:hypothetical protein